MVANGWTLYTYCLFDEQLTRIVDRVQAAAKADPKGYKRHPVTKLLTTIQRYIEHLIPQNPNAPEFRQGNTLGKDNRHWFRAKFHDRYRLFYRFSTKDRVIVYCWLNDQTSLRKSGSKSDPYVVFQSMLERGDPPRSLNELIGKSREMS